MTGLLIFIGLILVILNVLSIKKQNKSFNGVLGNAIENTHDYDIRLGELRREFSESILDIQSELMNIKEIVEKNNRLHKDYDHQQDEKIQPISSYSEDVNGRQENEEIYNEDKNKIIIDESHSSNSSKVEEIKRLFSEGLDLDEISEIVHLGKGEVLLIKDLYIR